MTSLDWTFFFLISAKNDFVLADGLVVIFPATFGTPDFFVTTFFEAVVVKVGACFAGTYLLRKYDEESSSSLFWICWYPCI